MAIEIVDFPMKNGGSFHCYVAVHQRVFGIEDIMVVFMGYVYNLQDSTIKTWDPKVQHEQL